MIDRRAWFVLLLAAGCSRARRDHYRCHWSPWLDVGAAKLTLAGKPLDAKFHALTDDPKDGQPGTFNFELPTGLASYELEAEIATPCGPATMKIHPYTAPSENDIDVTFRGDDNESHGWPLELDGSATKTETTVRVGTMEHRVPAGQRVLWKPTGPRCDAGKHVSVNGHDVGSLPTPKTRVGTDNEVVLVDLSGDRCYEVSDVEFVSDEKYASGDLNSHKILRGKRLYLVPDTQYMFKSAGDVTGQAGATVLSFVRDAPCKPPK